MSAPVSGPLKWSDLHCKYLPNVVVAVLLVVVIEDVVFVDAFVVVETCNIWNGD